jgi:antitoxin HicB
MKYHFKIHKEAKGYWAECLELQGCVTQANTKAQLLKNMKEALDVYLSEPEGSQVVFPAPNPKHSGQNIAEVSPSVRTAFASLMRRTRLQKHMTQKQAAAALQMASLYTYQKLEKATTANPGLETLAKIKSAFPEFPIEDVFSD